MSERVALYSGTRNLYHDMVTASKSLLYHEGADHVYFLIEDNKFPEHLPSCVTCIPVQNQTILRHDGPNFNTPWTYMALIRCALTQIFPNLDKILVLDVDTVVHKPIDYLWDLDISRYYCAGVEETQIAHRRKPYFNFGVMMHNLRKLRDDGADDTIIRTINTVHMAYPEQDALNSVCYGHILQLPFEYNAIRFNLPKIPAEDVVIKHYADTNEPMNSHEDYLFFDNMSWDDVLAHKEAKKP